MEDIASHPKSTRHTIPLNWDILYDLASYLPQSSLVALTSTCKELRGHCARALLERDPISFATAGAIESFQAFITSNIAEDPGHRGAYIRMLDLDTGSDGWILEEQPDSSPRARVVEILRMAPGLQAVRLSGYAFWLEIFTQHFRASPSIFSTLRRVHISIGSLQTLGHTWRPEKISELLQDVKHIPLKVLVVDSYLEDSDLRPSIIQLFSVFADTLEEIHISNSIFVLPILPPSPTRGLQFPHVQKLSVSGLWWTRSSLTDLGSIITCFPNVKSLAFAAPFHCIPIGRRNPLWWQAAIDPAITTIPARTVYNLVPITNVGPPAFIRDDSIRQWHGRVQEDTRWEALDYLGGCCDHLYGLAITSKVERLDIYDTATVWGSSSTVMPQICTIVRDCSPTKLFLTITYALQRDLSVQNNGLVDLLPRSFTHPLQYLQIIIETWADGNDLYMQLPDLAARASGLRTLIVTQKDDAAITYPYSPEQHTQPVGSQDFVHHIASLSPALRYVGLPDDLFGQLAPELELGNQGATNDSAHNTSYWEIVSSNDGDIHLERVPPDVAALTILEPSHDAILTSAFP